MHRITIFGNNSYSKLLCMSQAVQNFNMDATKTHHDRSVSPRSIAMQDSQQSISIGADAYVIFLLNVVSFTYAKRSSECYCLTSESDRQFC